MIFLNKNLEKFHFLEAILQNAASSLIMNIVKKKFFFFAVICI